MKILLISLFVFINSIYAVPDKGDITHTGDGTYYDLPSDEVNCSYDINTIGNLYGAMNKSDYDNSTSCGSFVHVVGPKGEATIRIVDQCPECSPGDIDFSPSAFDLIADKIDGRVNISWKYIRGNVTEPITYTAKKGSNRWWFAVLIDKHNTPIANVEIEINGTYQMLERQSYNYWLIQSDIGAGPVYKFRVTDIYGEQLEDNINFNVNLNSDLADYASANGHSNFLSNTTAIKKRKVFSMPGYSLVVGPTPFLNNNANLYYKINDKDYDNGAKVSVYSVNNKKIMEIKLRKNQMSKIDLTSHISSLVKGTYIFVLNIAGVDKACFISYK